MILHESWAPDGSSVPRNSSREYGVNSKERVTAGPGMVPAHSVLNSGPELVVCLLVGRVEPRFGHLATTYVEDLNRLITSSGLVRSARTHAPSPKQAARAAVSSAPRSSER